jgi:hypothetical protein
VSNSERHANWNPNPERRSYWNPNSEIFEIPTPVAYMLLLKLAEDFSKIVQIHATKVLKLMRINGNNALCYWPNVILLIELEHHY